MSSERVAQRVHDIIDNIEAAVGYCSGMDRAIFESKPMVRDACERCLQRLTEAAIKIGERQFASISPSTQFAVVKGMGNTLRHAYDEIDPAIIFETIKGDLPQLLDECRAWLVNNAGEEC